MVSCFISYFNWKYFICINTLIRKHTNIRAYVTYLVVSAHTLPQTQLLATPTKYRKILIDRNPNLQIVVAVAHTREIS